MNIRILIVSIFAVFLSGADTNIAFANVAAPRPSIDITLPNEISAQVKTGTLHLYGESAYEMGPPEFDCQRGKCSSKLMDGFPSHLRLELEMKDGRVIMSNVFSTAGAGGVSDDNYTKTTYSFETTYQDGNLQIVNHASPEKKLIKQGRVIFLDEQNSTEAMQKKEKMAPEVVTKEEVEAQKYIQQLQGSPYKKACTIGIRTTSFYRYYILRLPEGNSIRRGDDSATGAVAKLKDAISKGECEPEYKKTETAPTPVMQKE